MKIATWNISAGINPNDYKGEFFDKEKESTPDDKCLNAIANDIIKHNIDIIALQEVITTDSFNYMKNLSQKTNLKYYETFENSPCHLIENANFGVAILSKYPLSTVRKEFFKNPNLKKQTATGLYHTHDKGYLVADVNAPKPFKFLSASLLPFHRFDHNIVDFKDLFIDFQNDILKNNIYALGDFNAILGKSNLQMVFDKLNDNYEYLFDEITTTDNKKCDNIILPKGTNVVNKYIVTNDDISDHFLCVAEIKD